MTDAGARDVLVLPPIADDPIFAEDLLGESSPALEVLTEVSDELPRPRSGDPRDFAALFIRHRWSFALHARRFLHDERDVDEVVQEGFLRLFLAMPELETELQALAYCRRTITNLCIDRYRAEQRRPRLLDLETLPDDIFSEDDEVDPIVQAEDAAIVRQALAMLSPLHRAALIKREVEEKPLPQIAMELDITVEQTKHLLHRARRSLRRLLVGTHVEPGVDLDLAMVLAANRERAARAAKPTGAAALAILLVLAGVMGLRSGSGSRRVVEVAPAGSPFGPTLGDPQAPRPNAPRTPSVVSSHPAVTGEPGTSTQPPRTVLPQPKPEVVPSKPTTAPHRRPTGRPVTPPPVVIPVQPASYVVSGVGGSGAAQVGDQQRALRDFGTTSSSTISTGTAAGTYALRQSYSFAPDGALLGVTLNEDVPVGEGSSVGTEVSSAATSVETLDDGSLHLVTTGTATPLGAVNGQAVAPRDLTVDVVLAPDLVQIVSERVHVVESTDPAVPSSAPSNPDPAVPAVPQPSAAQLPLGFGSRDTAAPAVVVQDRGTG
ncbi:MAG: polymerase subunit sigma-24 [Frankiales bacterium]|nr:polymerase subunit sigma-24 [Frankiales bacterium]